MTNHSIPIHHSQKDGRSRPFFPGKMHTIFVPHSYCPSYHLRCPYRTTFATPTLYHLRYALFCQLSITQTLPTFPNFPTFPGFPTFPKRFTLPTLPKCFPTHNSHPPHLPPRLYIAGRRYSLSLNSQNSQNSY